MKKLYLFQIGILIILMQVLSAMNVYAQQQSALLTKFPNDRMVLVGSALKRFWTFKVVTVHLYVADQYRSQDILSDVPKRIEVNYHVPIAKQELDKATIKGIKQNLPPDQVATLMPHINQINSYYPNVKPGDQIAVTYIPGLGSRVQINGEEKGIVPSKEFAQAFFSIWVGKNPVDKQAKLKLLGLR